MKFKNIVDFTNDASEWGILKAIDLIYYRPDLFSVDIRNIYKDFLKIEDKKLSKKYSINSNIEPDSLDTIYRKYIEPNNKFEYEILKDLDNFLSKDIHDRLVKNLFEYLFTYKSISD